MLLIYWIWHGSKTILMILYLKFRKPQYHKPDMFISNLTLRFYKFFAPYKIHLLVFALLRSTCSNDHVHNTVYNQAIMEHVKYFSGNFTEIKT